MLIGWALLEAPAFMACIAYLLEAQAFAAALVGMTIVLMLIRFPTEGRVRGWLEQQNATLSDLHQQQGRI